ncbi:MAG: polyprenol monophosphomannose synthase [Planctomycetaceae bacterium]|jgi:dolichol-phosphate mannosyltransferase|nr:polyprenol monophosphomannose synthase [Planctomycetaceae bacterium]
MSELKEKEEPSRSLGRTLISLATYNELENMPIIVREIFEYAPDVDILVVDDNSPDGTADWVLEHQRTEPRLKLLKRAGKLGLGTAILDAIEYAVKNDYEFLINMDADLSHPPKFIQALRQKANEPPNGYDVVIGSRYIKGGGVEGWAMHRRWMSYAINLFAKLMLGLKTKDNSGSFRCYKLEKLKNFDRSLIISNGYSFMEEFLFRLKKQGATITEVPIIFVERRFGSSKINKKEAIDAIFILLKLGIRGR